MEVTLAEVSLRHLDVPSEGQRGYSLPYPARVKEEANPRAQGSSMQEGVDAAEDRTGIDRARREAERRARLLAESVVNIRVAFHVDNETGDVTIKVIDNVTGEVVRTIPQEEVMAMMQKLREFVGLVVDKRR